MAFAFPEVEIPINQATVAWGPYLFNFWPCVPDPHNDPVDTVTVRSFLGAVETTAQLIQAQQIAAVGNAVNVWFQYPGAGLAGSHTLTFNVTLDGGGINEFTMGYIVVT